VKQDTTCQRADNSTISQDGCLHHNVTTSADDVINDKHAIHLQPLCVAVPDIAAGLG